MENTSQDPIRFNIIGIKTEQFAVFFDLVNQKKEISLNTSLQFKIDNSSQKLGVFALFEFKQNKNIIIIIEVSCHFKIDDNAWNNFFYPTENKIIIPKGFVSHLGMITVGTTRGVLHEKLDGKTYPELIIPSINVLDMIPKDLEFDVTPSI